MADLSIIAFIRALLLTRWLTCQRDETNGVISRNVEFSQLIIDYQRKLREGAESVLIAEELSRKLTMEVNTTMG